VGVTYLAIPLGSLFTTLFVIERMVAGSQHERPVVRFGDSA
jgi:TRAP-type C4-dicarboxylate transport system permease small subunit